MASAIRGFLCLLLCSIVCLAQAERASITGTVTDSSGADVAGATVKVIDERQRSYDSQQNVFLREL
jgi:hypothetical protein